MSAQPFQIGIATLMCLASAMCSVSLREAHADDLKACMQDYADWIRLRDNGLRPLDANAALIGNDAHWCAPSDTPVAELRKRLFSLDKTCEKVTPAQKQQIVALMIQSLQMLKRIAPCPPSQATVVEATVVAAPQTGEKPPKPNTKATAPVEQKTKAAKPENTTYAASANVDDAATRILVTPPPASLSPRKSESTTSHKSIAFEPELERVGTIQANDLEPAPSLSNAEPLTALRRSPLAPAEESCLKIESSATQSYVIDASRCTSRVTLAAIDLYPVGAAPRCITTRVSHRLEIKGESERMPEINFQCVALAGGCTTETLRAMFPECAAH